MKLERYSCEICHVEAKDEKQLRHENWIQLRGGTTQGVQVWLEQPRKKDAGFMLTVGFRDRMYDFCSIDCLAKALRGKVSI